MQFFPRFMIILTIVTAFAGNLFGQTPAPSAKPAPAPAPTTSAAPASATKSTGTTGGVTAALSSGGSGIAQILPSTFKSTQSLLGGVYNGAYAYGYPIGVPEGTSGMTPSVSLEYNSAIGNDWAGVGFRIGGLSVIQRDLSKPVNFDTNDSYTLDYQKLYYNTVDTAFHTERESFDTIQTFSTTAPTTPIANPNITTSFWVVCKKDGTRLYYGQTADSRIDAVGKSGLPRLWALNKVIDPQGNYYTVTYNEDTTNGDYYPVRIVYTQNDAFPLSSYKTIQFSYETRSDHGALFLPTKVDMDYRLKWISILIGTDVNGSGGTLLRKYRMDYQNGSSTGRSRVVSIQEYGNDGNTPSAGLLGGNFTPTGGTLPAVNFGWQTGGGAFQTWGWTTSSGVVPSATAYLADVNGDGKADLVYPNPNGGSVAVAFSGSGFNPNTGFSSWDWISPNGVIPSGPIYLADVNGDGKADIVYPNPSAGCVSVALSGDGFLGTSWHWTWTSPNTVTPSGSINLADINGDGKADLVYVDTGAQCISVALSGDGFLPATGSWHWTWTSPAGSIPSSQIYLADVNGDGKADLIYPNSSVAVALSGNGFLPKTGSWHWDWISPNGIIPSGQIYLTDVNGDGKADLIYPNSSVAVALSGDGFLAGSWHWSWTSPNGVIPSGPITLTDVNGDGKNDLIYVNQTIGSPGLGSISVALSGSGFLPTSGTWHWDSATGSGLVSANTPYNFGDFNGDAKVDLMIQNGDGSLSGGTSIYLIDLVSTVTTAAGGTINITYTPAAQMSGAVDPAQSTYPDISDTRARLLVSQVTTNNNLGEATTVSYTYKNGKIRAGLDWNDLSFQQITSNDSLTRTIANYRQDYPYQGLIQSQLIQDTAVAPKTYAETDYTYNTAVQIGTTKSYFVSLQSQLNKSFDGLTTSTNTKTDYTYDAYGNLLTQTNSGFVNDSGVETPANQYATTKTTLTYAKASSGNLFRLATKKTEAYDMNNAFVTTSQTQYYYDGNSTIGTVTAGLLTKVENNIDATTKATTTMTYDNWGNVLTIQDPRVNASEYTGNTATITYDTTYHSLVTSTTNALNYTNYTHYETHLWPDTGTDANNQVTQWAYDSFGRTVKIAAPLDDLTSPTTTISYTDAVAAPFSPASVSTYQKTTGANSVRSISYYDGLGRTFQTKNQNVGANWTTADVYFDAQGRVFKEGVPYLTNTASYTVRQSTPIATELTYDILGRVTQVKHPDTTTSQTKYDQTKVTSIDENNHVSVTEVDASNPRSVFKRSYTGTYPNQALYATTTVKAFAGKSQIFDNAGNVITSTEDLLGRRIQYQDQDMGTWGYQYNLNGDLIQQTDAKSQVISFQYDKLGRLTNKASGATTLATYTYDSGTNGIGRLSGTTYNRGSDAFTYDVRGRVTQIQRTLDSITKTLSTTYDSADRKATQTYPDGEVLTYDYGADGALTGFHSTLASYLSGVVYNPLGLITSQTYGNGVATSFNYYDSASAIDPTTNKAYSYRLRQILAGTGGAVQNITYSYDAIDNVKIKTDVNDSTKSETYGYDELDRLTSATAGVYGNLAFQYDALNRLTQKDGNSYSYYSTHPHQVQSFGSNNYVFDNNGNMTSRSDGRTIAYDVMNRVTSISDGGTYSYGTGRQRTIKTEGMKTSYYFFKTYEEEYTSGALTNTIKYYGGVAERSTTQGLVYRHSDNLGSSSVLTDSNGNVVKRQWYKPYGSDAGSTGTATTKYQFTGYEKEANGLHYANARYYDPDLGMFIQPDPAIWDGLINAPLTLAELADPYLYALDSPANVTDPTGMFIPLVIWGVVIAAETVADAIVAGTALSVGVGVGVAMSNAEKDAKRQANQNADSGAASGSAMPPDGSDKKKSRSSPNREGEPNSTQWGTKDGKITKYTEYDSKGNFVKEVRSAKESSVHGETGPTTKEATYNTNPKTGETFFNGFKDIRRATPEEIAKLERGPETLAGPKGQGGGDHTPATPSTSSSPLSTVPISPPQVVAPAQKTERPKEKYQDMTDLMYGTHSNGDARNGWDGGGKSAGQSYHEGECLGG